jgi:hypothetical protein
MPLESMISVDGRREPKEVAMEAGQIVAMGLGLSIIWVMMIAVAIAVFRGFAQETNSH